MDEITFIFINDVNNRREISIDQYMKRRTLTLFLLTEMVQNRFSVDGKEKRRRRFRGGQWRRWG